MKTEQKALLVTSDLSIRNLNELLAEGWRVIAATPMPSSTATGINEGYGKSFSPTCLVIIEK